MPKGLRKLSSLQVFKGFLIAKSKRTPTRIGDLKSLENITRLSIQIGSEAEISHGEFEKLKELKLVEKLKVSWGVVSNRKKSQAKVEDSKLPHS